jgi:hypothetical protein
MEQSCRKWTTKKALDEISLSFLISGLTIEVPENVDIQNNNHVTSPHVTNSTSPLGFIGQLLHLRNRSHNNM